MALPWLACRWSPECSEEKFCHLTNENSKLLKIVDSIQQHIRFNETGASEIYRASKSQWGQEIKSVIQRFCGENVK